MRRKETQWNSIAPRWKCVAQQCKGMACQRMAKDKPGRAMEWQSGVVRWICLASHGKVMARRGVEVLGSGTAKHGSDGQMQSAARMAMELRGDAKNRNGEVWHIDSWRRKAIARWSRERQWHSHDAHRWQGKAGAMRSYESRWKCNEPRWSC